MTQLLAHADVEPLLPVPPRWVEALIGANPTTRENPDDDVRLRDNGAFTHASTCIRDAIGLDAAGLRARVRTAYLAIFGALASRRQHPIRLWNFLPGIGEPMSSDLNRYMVFNAGRADAHALSYGADHSMATASAVGITGADLFIHCLATERPGTPVENPRQTPAWQYSSRYGPVPPTFSRGTIVTLGERRHLLIGGTASVVGEDSRHAGDLEAQLTETFLNIESLVRNATHDMATDRTPLQRLVDVRAYVKAASHGEQVRRRLSKECSHLRVQDIVVAQICRPELLVEIEGLAEF